MAAPGPQLDRGHPPHPPGWATCAEEEQDTPGTHVPLGKGDLAAVPSLKKQNCVPTKAPRASWA